METPADRIKKVMKQWFAEFSKSKFAIPTMIALSCLVYFAVVSALSVVCFSNLIAPLVLLGLLWKIGVKRVKKLLVIGAVATVFYAAILTVLVIGQLQHVDPVIAESVDGRVTGTLDPLFGDKTTTFTYTIRVNLTDKNLTVTAANVIIVGIQAFGSDQENRSMTPVAPYESGGLRLYNFTYSATTTKPVNQYIFRVNYNGTWATVGEKDELNNMYYIQGPMYSDSFALAPPVIVSAFQLNFFYVFGPYAIICGMIWWTRRARRMREKQIEKWQAEHAKEEAEKPKTRTSKVPSLDATMGKVEEGFVCSECGADVPADATVCPKCGEKFD